MGHDLRFDAIREHRGWYYVEYHPPLSNYRFATLALTIPQDGSTPEQIAVAMEDELAAWLKRYPVPLMVSAFDKTGSLLHLEGTRSCAHLIGYLHPESFDVVQEWRLVPDKELPDAALDHAYIEEIYADVPSKTSQEIREKVEEDAQKMRLGWWIVFLWAAVVPAFVAILEWWSDWLGVVVLLYSLAKAIKKALQLLGKWPKSPAERQREDEDLEMRHHHYHCKRNPDGFLRLKMENFERWATEEIQKEAASVKSKPR
jgi:hypothetical protein